MKNSSGVLFTFLAAAVVAGVLGWPVFDSQVSAQNGDPSIDDVINQLDQDFTFGGKENIKRDNIQNANEQNREDIKIEEEAKANAGPTSTLVDFSIIEATGPDAAKIDVEVVGIQILATMLDAASIGAQVSLPSGTTQTLKVSCTSVGPMCDFDVAIISGAVFLPPTPPTATGPQLLGNGGMATFPFQVN